MKVIKFVFDFGDQLKYKLWILEKREGGDTEKGPEFYQHIILVLGVSGMGSRPLQISAIPLSTLPVRCKFCKNEIIIVQLL